MKKALVLVGPKGAGKSTFGDLLDRRLGIPFIRVEPVFLAVRDEMGASHPEYERRGFEAVLASLQGALELHEVISFESTGASVHAPWLLEELGRIATVLPIRIIADPSLCVERISRRDASIHIPVSDDQVERINAIAFKVEMEWALEIDNRGEFDPEAIVEKIAGLLHG